MSHATGTTTSTPPRAAKAVAAPAGGTPAKRAPAPAGAKAKAAPAKAKAAKAAPVKADAPAAREPAAREPAASAPAVSAPVAKAPAAKAVAKTPPVAMPAMPAPASMTPASAMAALDGLDALAPWPDRPTPAQRIGAQHAVARLLDALAPQKPPARRDGPLPPIQRHRTPSGCILQATGRAVTVSWFPAATHSAALGELQLITWRGTVSRPGSAVRAATVAQVEMQETFELLAGRVGPVSAGPDDDWRWRAVDGATYDAQALAARCHSLLEAEAAAA